MLPCPGDNLAFNELAAKYVRHGGDYVAMVDRIVTYYSVRLPGTLGKDNRTLMHNFVAASLRGGVTARVLVPMFMQF